jgi:hypothetical integral membrane protein (TIGR02206 family)
MRKLWSESSVTFNSYGFTHWALLLLTVVGAVWLVRFGRRYRDTPTEARFTRVFAIVQLAVTVGFMALWLVPPLFTLGQSLPLHLSDLLRLVTGFALLSKRPWAYGLCYYWGLTLNPQALLTPDLHPDVAPLLEIISYWVQHILVMWAVLYLTWGLGLRPTWRSYRLALAATIGWAMVVFGVNRGLGTNYGYLNGKPSGGSLLDLMGGWPAYLLVVLALAATVWALITWPWTRTVRKPAHA